MVMDRVRVTTVNEIARGLLAECGGRRLREDAAARVERGGRRR
jgi:hypothetical protein